MITRTDIEEYVFDLVRGFGVPVTISDHFPVEGEVKGERIIIIGSDIEGSGHWLHSVFNINWLVPDIKGEPSARVGDVERVLAGIRRGSGMIDGTAFRYSVRRRGKGNDKALKVHYANLQLLIEPINTL